MATVYLAPAPTGDDTRTYVQAQNPATPWATVGKVNTSAVSGDTVQMAAGTYAMVATSWTKTFTFNGASLSNGLPTTILDGGNGATNWDGLRGNWNFSNITWQNIKAGYQGVPFWFNGGNSTTTFTNCMFKNIDIADAAVGGHFVRADSPVVTININSCIFNDVYESTAVYAIMLFVASGAGTINVNNCTLYFKTLSNGLYIANGGTITFKNCIMANYAVGGAGVYWYTGTASYCDSYQILAPPAGTGNITSDPLWIDAANANFNLRPTSPCLGTGIIV